MTSEEINKRFAKAAGIKPKLFYLFTDAPAVEFFPPVCSNPLLVLEAMSKRDDWSKFNDKLPRYTQPFIEIYILDKTGRFALKAAEYLETEGGKK
jgi:hypothetical protein